MSLTLKNLTDRNTWLEKGYELPGYDREALKEKTVKEPNWIHFGAGNIFRAFPAAVLQEMLNQGEADRGVIVAEGFDYDIIDQAYAPYDSLSLLVVLKADGSIEKKVIGSVTESIRANAEEEDSWARLEEIFRAPSLQMVSFTITEKGYSTRLADGSYPGFIQADLKKGLHPNSIMGKIAALLYTRYQAGAAPIAMVSMDNCSHNGDKLFEGVMTFVREWRKEDLVEAEFEAYVTDPARVSFPWSMIDKITPRPDARVKEMLEKDGFADTDLLITQKNTYTSPFVNAEEVQYLVIEDAFPNGRPRLEAGGVLITDRSTVDQVEKMKVCTCLNPLHTAMSIYGCLLGHTLICEEMQDPQLKKLVTVLGYQEGMPVVVDPGIIRPQTFIGEVLEKRLPNPFMPDAPQRIATDTSQKLPIRFGETLKAYQKQGMDVSKLICIPLVFAGYARYLMGIDDLGQPFTPSSDPLLEELMQLAKVLKLGEAPKKGALQALWSRTDIFGVDLYELGLVDKIEGLLEELTAGIGAVRKVLKKYLGE